MTGLLLNADTLMMRNGNRVNGTFVSGDNRSIRIDIGGHVNTYNLNEVDSIQFTGGQQGYGPNSSSSYPSNSGYQGNSNYSSQPNSGYGGNTNYPTSNYPASNQNYAQGTN